MKSLLKHLELPTFLKDSRLTASIMLIIGLSFLGGVCGLIINWTYGIAMVLIFIFTIIISAYGAYVLAQNANNFAANLSYRIKRSEQEALIKMPLGILLYDKDHQIQWVNPYLQLYLKSDDLIGHPIKSVDEDLERLLNEAINADTAENRVVEWDDHQFEMVVQDELGVIYLLDISKYANIEERYYAERLAIAQIFIDNYDELSETMSDQELANMSSYIQTTLSAYAGKFNSYLKRIDEDHFILLSYVESINQMKEDKFSVIDRVRQETSRQNMPLTLSVGIAYGANSLPEIATQAQSNLDLALGRGGDQVVVRVPGQEVQYFGGKSNPMEKRTRVRARMVSQAVTELFKDADRVFVVGHQFPDMDSVGSALGIVKIAQFNGIDANVVLDTESNNYDVARLITKLKATDENVLINSADAINLATDRSILVMVDHSKYSISYCQPLYEKLKNRIIVIDHHRRGEEFPENPILTYVEPYASSACELVAEMVEYQQTGKEKRILTSLDATAMLAGIVVDSKEFSLRTGTRTFDAASYLRSIGADSMVVSELLKEDISSFLKRTHLVATLDMVKPNMAVLMGDETELYDQVLTAQAADTALDLQDVEASFAITRSAKDTVRISARSMGKINVQLIMEKLGGGGHLSNAATQIKDKSLDEVKAILIKAIDEYLAESQSN
ncbi:MAG: DHH family phosphoesterase [Lactobacillus sp.]|nr:DHH family phosphoesterase [Lactobacillus sp.]